MYDKYKEDASGDLLPDKLHMTCNLPMNDHVNGL